MTAVPILVGCRGDNSAVRAFHPTVALGMPLADAILKGEVAQSYDITYAVTGVNCETDEISITRHSYGPSIRITHPPPDPERQWEQAYNEVGFANREEFAAGLAEMLPAFYSCETFRFTFGRYQGWPKSDFFTVTIGPTGMITSVSELQPNEY